MDGIEITAASPQEDEFALLALGARSPYEALLAPDHLAEALALSDPLDLHADETQHWRDTFVYFLNGVSIVEGGRPLILKSPPHGYRVATIRQLVPDARFVLIVRSPETVYESAVRMWRSLFPIYSLGTIPPEDATRRAVLADRPRFETKLREGVAGLPQDRFAQIHYEELVRDPVNVIGRLYERLRLGGFSDVEPAIKAELARRGEYTARNAQPPEYWLRQVQTGWRSIFEQYGYAVRP